MRADRVQTAAAQLGGTGIDAAVYAFRRQLAGCDGFEIPPARPLRADYIQAHEERCEKRRQGVERKHGPQPHQEALF